MFRTLATSWQPEGKEKVKQLLIKPFVVIKNQTQLGF
jgi:hypothetical protein